MSFTGLPTGIPALVEMQSRAQWVAWKYEHRKGANEKPTKPPVSPRSGFGASHSDPRTWGSYSEAAALAARRNLPGVGFVLSHDDEYTGIDLDGVLNDDGDIEPWAGEIVALAETYCEVSPSGRGLRLIARGKIGKAVKHDPAGVEIYDDKRYLTITGAHYPPSPTEIREAPRTIAALIARVEAMKPRKEAPEPQAQVARLGSDFFANVNRRALECLSLWVPSIFPTARMQQGTGAYRVSSRDLGRDLEEDLSIAPNGIKDWGVHDMGDPQDGARTAIDICLEHGQHADAKAAAFWLCGRMGTMPENLGWSATSVPPDDGYDPSVLLSSFLAKRNASQATLVAAPDGTIHDADTGEIIEEAPDAASAAVYADDVGAVDYLDMPEEHLRPPGVVGEIADWICDTTGEPIRVHAVAAALVTVGTLIARKVYSFTNPTASNLFVGILAPSSIGKDHPQNCMKLLLDAATKGRKLHAGWVTSAPKLGMMLHETAGMVMIADEFAEKFTGTRNRNAGISITAMNEVLKEVWGRNQGSYDLPATLNREMTVQRPALSIFGAATLRDFREMLNSKDVTGGLYNRFLFVPRYADIPMGDEREGSIVIPERLLMRCQWLYGCLDDFNMSLSFRGDGYPPNPILVPFSPAALAMNQENRIRQRELRSRADQDIEFSLYGRFAEMTKRVAMIIACGRSSEMLRNAVIEAGDMRFAANFVGWSIDQLVRMVRRDMVENQYQAQYNLVLDIIRQKQKISRSNLYVKVKGRLRKSDLDAVIASLVEAHCIAAKSDETDGRPRVEYRYLRG